SQPNAHTRRYDRQLRLWAASGQQALESSRVLVIRGTATSTSILKNLVLPGIGYFTILDAGDVTPEDAGNNFFLHYNSIGKPRAEEAVRFLNEMNDSVQGEADTSDISLVITQRPEYFKTFHLVIAHNTSESVLAPVSKILWEDPLAPPLIVVRSAGFLADFSVQFHEHTIVDSHSEDLPSYRLDQPIPPLLEHALSLDLDGMDVTDHGHIPYFAILVRAMYEWKRAHGGNAPSYKELKDFKEQIVKMKKKDDEENFDEAVSQVYKVYQKTTVPSNIQTMFSDPKCVNLDENSSPFFILLHALSIYTKSSKLSPNLLPLSPTLPDLKSDTKSYIHLQQMYKDQANAEKAEFKSILQEVVKSIGSRVISDSLIDEFVRNCHQLRLMRGKAWGESDKKGLLQSILTNPAQVSTNLALSALFAYEAKNFHFPTPGSDEDLAVLTTWVYDVLAKAEWKSEEQHLANALAEIVRAPTADLPTTAALLGGFIAQEAIKLITRQYIPIDGTCVIDMISSTTGTIKV
ncbi:uncharacterized protein EI90DRAFT_2929486, partial [Cantharellus anzutake]|uniref:uncharacterized protein n=1 Tax=Cantharellus anzutake TaxID=1750568 RepID=UPI001903E6C5